MEIPVVFFVVVVCLFGCFNCSIIGDTGFQSPFVFVANVRNAFQAVLF